MSESSGPDKDSVGFSFSKEAMSRMEADYQDRMNMFRANVVQLLRSVDALHGGEGWAVFGLHSDPENRHTNPAFNGGFKDILVMLASGSKNAGTSPPSIRILTNESYKTPDGLTWLTQDFSCDHEGDSQYMVDACNPQLDPTYKDTMGVFFVYEDDNLVPSNNLVGFTPYFEMFAIVDEDKGASNDVSVMPFGHYSCLEDRVCALDYGISLLEEIVDTEPYARMTKSDTT
jgi:hypothetical protein